MLKSGDKVYVEGKEQAIGEVKEIKQNESGVFGIIELYEHADKATFDNISNSRLGFGGFGFNI
jgi:hypothetical protein